MLSVKFVVSKFSSSRDLFITMPTIEKYLKPIFRGSKFIINCAVCEVSCDCVNF